MIKYIIQFIDDTIHYETFTNIIQIEEWADGFWIGKFIYLQIDTSKAHSVIKGRVLDEDKVLAKIWALKEYEG